MKTTKLFAIMLALLMSISLLTIPAFADDPEDPGDPAEDISVDFKVACGTTDVTGALGSDLEGLKLSLTLEKLVGLDAVKAKFDVVAYGIDGKWKAGTPSDKIIAGLFNKGGKLELTDNFDSKAKSPAKATKEKKEITLTEGGENDDDAIIGTTDKDKDGNLPPDTDGKKWKAGDKYVIEVDVPAANVITFAKVEKRPKAEKLVVNYAIGAAPSGKDDLSTWILTKKAATTVTNEELENIQICVLPNGQTPIRTQGTRAPCKKPGKRYSDLLDSLKIPPINTKSTNKFQLPLCLSWQFHQANQL